MEQNSIHTHTLDNDTSAPADDNAVAIIGMAGQFPGAESVTQFWDNLREGRESITRLEQADLLAKGLPQSTVQTMLAHPSYVNAAASLPNVENFDAEFFAMPQREAEITDPQHRVLLECAQDALDHAGYTVSSVEGDIALYAGVGLNTYLLSNLMPNTDVVNTMGMHQLLLGNDKCYAATRIAYKLNLTGACVSVDTACSTSLVSIVMGYKALLGYECDMALAGGAKVNAADTGYIHEPGSINSADGHCRAFDHQASGTVFGSGAGMVVMKRLEDALDDGDHILGVIRGGAVNNDGSQKVGFTAPNLQGQAEVIKQAFEFAEVPPSSISYAEAHGTGTRMGDPVELQALSEAFKESEEAFGSNEAQLKQACFIGSVKSNIGHLESAAGVTGVIKVLKAFEHKLIPASLNVEKTNPAIDFANSPFKVVTEATPWQINSGTSAQTEYPRRACVSSFGLGGTNAHLILEEPPVQQVQSDSVNESEKAPASHIMLLSAKSPSALTELAQRWRDSLSEQPSSVNPHWLQNLAYTSWIGRQAHEHRGFLVLNAGSPHNNAFADSQSTAFARFAPQQARRKPNVAFVLPGQGTQYVGMSRDLYQRFTPFREALDACFDCFEPALTKRLRELMLAEPSNAVGDEQKAEQQAVFSNTRLAQPAIFAHGYAMAMLLRYFGITPSALLGHSLGEILAAQLAGVFDLQSAATLVSQRADYMAACKPGSMVAVQCSLSDLQSAIVWLSVQQNVALDIAAINVLNEQPEDELEDEEEIGLDEWLEGEQPAHSAPASSNNKIARFVPNDNIVVSGSERDINLLCNDLRGKRIRHQLLHTSHAFHSDMMQSAEPALRALLSTIDATNAHTPIISCFTGKPANNADLRDPDFWLIQLTATVQFADGAAQLPEFAQCAVDLGPSSAVADLVLQNLAEPVAANEFSVFSAGRHPKDKRSESDAFLACLGSLWSIGAAVDWQPLYGDEQAISGKLQRTPLPAYPYQKVRCWIDPPQVETSGQALSEEAVQEPSQAPEHTQSAQTVNVDTDMSAEQKIASIWQQLLGCGEVSPNDDFFALGGQSLLATRMLAAVQEHTGVEITLNDFFDQPTVSALAVAVAAAQLVDDADEQALAALLDELE